jgi:hypothetical protein
MPRRWPRWPLLILLGCLAPVAGGAQGAESEVMVVVRGLFDGMRRADSAAVRPLFHPQARLISVTVRRDTAMVQVEASVDGFVRAVGRPRAEVWDERISNERVAADGPLASVWVDYEFYRDSTRTHCGVDHFLLVKESGSWRIVELADTRRGCVP